ncbi:hypothetical protein CKO44_06735 [Rubrivivax gelatinosus]|uniref:DUF1521 domain-containing protein n=1 Tax=Rubrivivax gelatinosus TaxID=28068 RepID=UPI001907BD2F|nr:DUF1521 domain-containing protein [Rubrivivax gelatinosus]MBK1613168.1 hypothetical protein [Rubrivivax gelatinosus]
MSLTTAPASPGIAPGGCVPPGLDPSNPSNASTRLEGGVAVFENDNYRITAGDDNQVLIRNKHTGETYRAWGDPHMEIDGKQAFDFWGTTSFVLDDGTKVTIETTPWAANPAMTLSSKVTISNGDYGVQITGVDTNTSGDLAIDEGRGWGRLVDWAVDDGNTLYENTLGKGFLGIDDQGRIRQVDQAFVNETDLLKGGRLAESYRDAFAVLGGLLRISFIGAFLATIAAARDDSHPAPRPQGPRADGPESWAGGTPSWRFDETGPVRPRQQLTLTLARLAD